METNTPAWILGALSTLIACLAAVSTFFIQKWIARVDEHLEENSYEIKEVKEKLYEIKSEQRQQTKSIPEAIRAELRATGRADTKLSQKLEESAAKIDAIAKTQPKLTEEISGKIILIQSRQSETEKKVETLYNTVKIIVDRLKPK